FCFLWGKRHRGQHHGERQQQSTRCVNTVCVLSRRYLRNDWCSLEMRVATHQLLEEQDHRLILIFLEHISPLELSAFHRSHHHFCRHSEDITSVHTRRFFKDFHTTLFKMRLAVWLLGLSLCEGVYAIIAKHCFIFNELLLNEMGDSISCEHRPGLSPYAECNISDFRTDLTEVKAEVRSLCVFHNARLIPDKAFLHVPSLEFLSIYGGRLNRVRSGAFFGLSNLKYLKIIFDAYLQCQNVSLEAQAFAGLDHLKELELTGFQFKNIASSTLSPLTALQSLMLARVCVKDLGEAFCRLGDGMSHLRYLSLVDSGVVAIYNRSCMTKSTVLGGVKVLNLDGNPIQIIQPGSLSVFQNLSNLSLEFHGQSVDSLWKSGIGQIDNVRISGQMSKTIFIDFTDLCQLITHLSVVTVELSHMTAEMLSEHSLQNCGMHLRMFNVWSSRIQQIDFGFWKNATAIKSLAMADMHLKEASFCNTANGTIWNITSLNLERNLLTEIKSSQFVCMPLLEQLILSNNSIELLLQGALKGLPRLRVLKLDSNKIKQLAYPDFESLPTLEILLLDSNDIQEIEEGTFRNQVHLEELTLGTLMLYEFYLSLMFYGFPPNLRHLSIDAGPCISSFRIGNISPLERQFTLYLNLYGASYFLSIEDCDNPFLTSVEELTLKAKNLMCRPNTFWSFFTNLESFELKGDPEDESQRYTDINTLHLLKRLKLVDLNLSNHTDPGMIFRNLEKLQILVLENCRLNFLMKNMFQDLRSLVLLRLSITNPLILLDGIFETLPSLKVIVLDRLDFRCDCENDWLIDWAQSSRQVQVVNLQHQECIWHFQKKNYLATMEKLCQTDVQYLCYLGTTIATTLLVAASVGYHFAYWSCVVLLLRLRGYVERKLGRAWRVQKRRVGQERGDLEVEVEEMKYDAFVSFSSHDEAWVFGELAPRLEEQGQPRLRLCLHHRDFEVGKGIMDNIAESVYSSRRTVCVLSRRYLRSDWCSLEMRVATHRLLEEQDHRLILIFLEHISPFELSAFHRLVTVLRSRTYLEWPEEPAKREHFWECLRRSIIKGNMVSGAKYKVATSYLFGEHVQPKPAVTSLFVCLSVWSCPYVNLCPLWLFHVIAQLFLLHPGSHT
ncbi:hypothetical protein NFI96_026400, partial [Prochilodus magdalenae]